ncbi:hypothetical protein HK098_000792 [Nowakowskiella sp. JEL0407]|nr:hypothetical protein HK098_000792 [Nowakowskiella sp. JEL0407]
MEGYDPWGKGGAGAPLRNADGTLVNNRTVQSQSQSQPLSQLQQQAPNVTNHDKSFLRGVINVDAMSPWQKEEYNKKHRAQQETQDILRAQIAEKEAQRRKIEEQQKKEEQKEQERIMKEQEMLKQRYARELEEQRRKEEESRLENERLKLEKEKAQKLKEETLSQEKDSVIKPDPIPIQQNLHLQTKKLPATQKERSLSPPIPTIKANLKTFGPPSSPPIPTLRKKAASNKPRQSSVVEAPKEAEVNKTPRVEVDVRSKDMETQEKYNLLEQLNKIQKELELEQMKIKHEITNSSILPPSQTVLEPHRRPHQRRPQKQTNEPVPMDNSFSNWRQELINHQNDLMIENAKNRIANFEEIDSFPMKKNPDLVVKKESDGWARISEIKPLYETQIETIKQQELYLNNLRGKLDLNATTPANTQESRIIDEFIRRKTRSEKKFTSQREDTFLLEEFLNRPSRKVNSNPSTPLTLSSLRKQVSDDTRYSLISESKLVFINPTDEKRHNDLSTKSRRNIQPQNDDEQHLLPFLNQKNEYLEMMKQTEATETPVENKPATPESVDYIKQLSQLNEKRLKNLLELESSQTTKKKTYTEEKSSMLYADLPDFTQSSEKIEELIRLKRNNRKSMKKADSEIYAQDSSLLSMNFGPAGLNLQPDSV